MIILYVFLFGRIFTHIAEGFVLYPWGFVTINNKSSLGNLASHPVFVYVQNMNTRSMCGMGHSLMGRYQKSGTFYCVRLFVCVSVCS